MVCFFGFEEEGEGLQTTLATLLLVTSAVILTCIVIDYAVVVVQSTLQTQDIPQLDRLRNLEDSLLNQTDSFFNQTLPQTQQTPFPTP